MGQPGRQELACRLRIRRRGDGGICVLALWLGRLIVLEASSPVIAVPALLAGFLVGPAWYLWVGRVLLASAPGGPPDDAPPRPPAASPR